MTTQENKFIVYGKIITVNNQPVRFADVVAYKKDLTGRHAMVTVKTDINGTYYIDYSAFATSNVNLLVVVPDAKDLSIPFAESSMFLNAYENLEVNLTVLEKYVQISEFKTISQAISAKLDQVLLPQTDQTKGERLVLVSLQEDEKAILADEIKVEKAKIDKQIQAKSIISHPTFAKYNGSDPISEEVLYALLPDSSSSTLDIYSVLRQDSKSINETIESALQQSKISLPVGKTVENLTSRLKDLVTDYIMDGTGGKFGNEPFSLKEVASVTKLGEKGLKAFFRKYVEKSTVTPDFWGTLTDFPEADLKKLKFAFDLDTLTNRNLPLVNSLFSAPGLSSIEDMPANIDADYLRGIAPDLEDYQISEIVNRIENTFPHEVTLKRMQKSESTFSVLLGSEIDYMMSDINLNLGSSSISTSVTSSYSEKGEVPPKNLISNLESIQRMYKMSSCNNKFECIQFLSSEAYVDRDGFLCGALDTADKITELTRSAFIEKYENSSYAVSRSALAEIYENARRINTYTVAALSKYHTSLNGSTMFAMQLPAISSSEEQKGGETNIEKLFGNSNYIIYDDGRTAYSPAAYLADLLAFLASGVYRGTNGTSVANPKALPGADSAQGHFFTRRADVQNIMLNSKNSFEAMPYIDIVNEVLENAIAGKTDYTNNTTAVSEDLKVHPQFTNYSAYKILADSAHPLNFNLYHEEARAYLDYLKISKPDLMKLFISDSSETKQLDIALENLGLTKKDCSLISAYPGNAYITPEVPSSFTKGYIAVLDITKFYHITYDELLEILDSHFVNPIGKMIEFSDDLNIDTAKINLSIAELKQAKIFNYLRKKLGWSVIELDRAIRAYSPATEEVDSFNKFTKLFLIFLSGLKTFKERYLNKSISELLILWSSIDIKKHQKEGVFYKQLFMGLDADAPTGSMKNPFEDYTANLDIAQHINEIARATNLTVDDVNEILAGGFNELNTASTTLQKISLLMRISYLSECLGISVKDLKAFMKLSGVGNPFAAPEITINFINSYKKFSNSGMNCDMANYILHNRPYDSAPLPGDVKEFIAKLEAELKKIDESEYSLDNYIGMVVTKKADQETLLKFIQEPNSNLPKAINPNQPTDILAIRKMQESFINDFAFFVDVKDAVKNLVIGETGKYLLTSKLERVFYALNNNAINNGIEINLDKLKRDVLIQLLSQELGIDADNARTLLETENNLKETGFVIFLGKSDEKKQFFYQLYFKISLLIKAFKIKSSDLSYLIAQHAKLGIFDLVPDFYATSIANNNANMEKGIVVTYDTTKYNKLKPLIDLYRVNNIIFDYDYSLIDYLKDIENPEITVTKKKEKLLNLTKWQLVDLDEFITKLGLQFLTNQGKSIVADLDKLIEAFRIAQQAGSDAKTVFAWSKFDFVVSASLESESDPDRKIITSIKNAAKFKTAKGNWKTAGRKIRDGLRIKQRDALEKYLLSKSTTDAFEDSSDLYSYYLIDTDVTPAVMTSRIVNAVSSIQLFVQRALLNLEKGVSFNQDATEEWKWRKNYRVWEANRKVFLYPENWIEPELRDDKTQFYKELEDEIMQVEVNNENMEKIYYNYLKKLDNIAHLKIIGFHKEIKADYEVLHVVGRTQNSPYQYFYCKADGKKTSGTMSYSWSSWEALDIGIEGDHVMPVVINDKLNLIWALFEEKIYSLNNKTKVHKYGVKFGLSERIKNLWSSRSVSDIVFEIDKQKIQENENITSYSKLQEAKDITFRLGESIDEENDKGVMIRAFHSVLGSGMYFTSLNVTNIFYNTINKSFNTKQAEDLLTDSFNEYLTKTGNKYICENSGFVSNTTPLRLTFKQNDNMRHILVSEEPFNFIDHNKNEFMYEDNLKMPIFFSDKKNTLFVFGTGNENDVHVESFKHPYTHLYLSLANIHGVNSFLSPQVSEFYMQGIRNDFFGNYLNGASGPNKANGPDFKLGYKHDDGLPLLFNYIYDIGPTTVFNDKPSIKIAIEPVSMSALLNYFILPFFGRKKLVIDYYINNKLYMTKKYHSFTSVSFYNAVGNSVSEDINNVNVNNNFNNNTINSLSIRVKKEGESYYYTKEQKVFVTSNVSDYLLYNFENIPNSNVIITSDQAIKIRLKPRNLSTIMSWLMDGFPFNAANRLTIKYSFDGAWRDPITYSWMNPPSSYLDIQFPPNLLENTNTYHKIEVELYNGNSSFQMYTFNFHYNIDHEFIHIVPPYPEHKIELGYGRPYSAYNWELFFHIPLAMAKTLSDNQKFEEARNWYHYIFDPTQSISTGSFWRFRPFHEFRNLVTIQQFMAEISAGGHSAEVDEWEDNPFNPHAIARFRTLPYMKAVVMMYIDNLLNWADQLFRRDTLEAINEATQLYILAADLLGKKPVGIEMKLPDDQTFKQLKYLGQFSNPYLWLHNNMSTTASQTSTTMKGRAQSSQVAIHSPGNNHIPNRGTSYISSLSRMFYFGIPHNAELMDYYSTVSDRLFKIRHNMDIEGNFRELALFAPPIDPAMLVKAVAAGVDIGSAINDMYVTSPQYKFEFIARKAEGLLGNVKALGSALLSALEKKDAEELSVIRSVHEITINESVKRIKEQLIEDAEKTIESLENSLEAANTRHLYYKNLVKESLNSFEKSQLKQLEKANDWEMAANITSLIGGAAALIPDIAAGSSGWGPYFAVESGGSHFSSSLNILSSGMRAVAGQYSFQANMNSIKGGQARRADEWKHQEAVTKIEIAQIVKQIEGAKIKLAIATKELENQEKQIENSTVVYEYMKSKYTNKQLYNWMVSRLSGLYFRSYQLAYDVAKTAEKAYRKELFIKAGTRDFIKFGYWDSLKKGLLAGEQLQQALSEMDVEYMNKNKRKLEITKHIPLSLVNPQALIDLKKGDGNNIHMCSFALDEEFFDIDYPGQYQRVIKSVSVTIPAVTGPYTNIGARVTISNSKIRTSGTCGNYNDEENFESLIAPVDSIATSNAVNDSGVFELSFRDERYIPFEGAGVISNWTIDLPGEFKQFDYSTIKDVILTIKYTAEYDGTLKTVAVNNLKNTFLKNADKLAGIVSLKESFSDKFIDLLAGVNGEILSLEKKHFPSFLADCMCKIKSACGYIRKGDKITEWTGVTKKDSEDKIIISGLTAADIDDIIIVYNYYI